jgi:probable phosphoglycerate mutase
MRATILPHKKLLTIGSHVILFTLQHWNARKHLQGCSDSHLTDVGQEQAEQAGRYLLKRFGKVAAIYASDLKRASHTASAIGKHLQMDIQHDERLRETNLGIFQGITWKEVSELYPEALADFSGDSRTCVPGGESHASKYCRVAAALHDFAHVHKDADAPIVVVCHGGIAREVHRQATRDPLLARSPTGVSVPNACISLLEYKWQDKQACSPACAHAHLPEGHLRFSDVVPCGKDACSSAYHQRGQGSHVQGALHLHDREVLLPSASTLTCAVPLTAEQWSAEEDLPAALLPGAVPLARCGELHVQEWGITEHLQHVT